MFGAYKIPFQLERDGISISTEKVVEDLIYHRTFDDEEVEKWLLCKGGDIRIHPIEPMHKPKEITRYLLVELDKTLIVEPKSRRNIYLTFPIEIGVFISGKKDFELLDVVTQAKQKLTLYGDPRNGIICKQWHSGVFPTIPQINPLHEGVIELNINNVSERWVEVTKTVFDAFGMKIYFDDELVSMKAEMKILSKRVAETGFTDSPLKKKMNKALELFVVRRLPAGSRKFTMREGV